jgi:hypothetical protein
MANFWTWVQSLLPWLSSINTVRLPHYPYTSRVRNMAFHTKIVRKETDKTQSHNITHLQIISSPLMEHKNTDKTNKPKRIPHQANFHPVCKNKLDLLISYTKVIQEQYNVYLRTFWNFTYLSGTGFPCNKQKTSTFAIQCVTWDEQLKLCEVYVCTLISIQTAQPCLKGWRLYYKHGYLEMFQRHCDCIIDGKVINIAATKNSH